MREGWREILLGDVVELVPGKYVPKSEYVHDGPFFIYGSNSIMGKYTKALIDGPHTVMAAIGANAGAVRYSAEPSWVNNNAFGLVANSEVEPKYLFLWLENILDLTSVVAGTGQPYVQRPSLKAAKMNLPSQAEQRRIVDLVSSVDTYIAALEQQADTARTARNAVLHELLSAGGEGWTKSTLGEVATWGSGGTPKSGNPSYYDGEIPWCVIGDLTEGEVRFTERRITQEGLLNSSAKIVRPGAVMVAMYGASIGRTGIVSIPMATNQAIAFAYVNESRITNTFLLLYLQTQKKNFVEAGQGAAQPNISQKVLKDWPILLPSVLEQKRIVDVVSSMDEVIESTEQAVADARSLRSGLLSDLLSGRHEISESYDRLLGVA